LSSDLFEIDQILGGVQTSWRRVKRKPGGARASTGSLSDDGGNAESLAAAAEARDKRNLNGAIGIAAVLAVLGAMVAAYSVGGPLVLMEAISKSGLPAAFSLIFVSEIGDKTFFIAMLLAMRHAKIPVLVGSSAALSLMTVISVAIGRLFQKVPAQLKTSIPIGEYAAVALLVYFGIRALRSAWLMPDEPSTDEGEDSELAAAEEVLKKQEAERTSKVNKLTVWQVLVESFSLVFLAEWGDRSMLATIALGAAQSPVGVALGASGGHVLATGLAVFGGSFLSQYISEKQVGYVGGVLFLVFAVATLLGVF
jgi:putative Ca2+/H+ antiporter (TMEM165/GDT1 family)